MERNLSVTAEERRVVVNQLPLIRQISNEEHLRDMVIETWVRVWRESGYRDISEAPNVRTEQGDDDSLVRHTNAVVRMVKAAAKEIQQVYGMNLNYDVLLAGAFLHDIDKLVILQRKGNLVEFSELGHKVPHGDYGARVAEQIGLPPEVVNIIASHNYIIRPGAPVPVTIEAVLLAYCDMAAFQAFHVMTGKGVYKFS